MPKVSGIPDVRFNLKSSKYRDRKTLISAIFRYKIGSETQRLVYSTRLNIAPKYWDLKRQLPRTSFENYSLMKSQLSAIQSAIHKTYKDLGPAPLPEFKERLNVLTGRVVKEDTGSDLIDFAKGYMRSKRNERNAHKNSWKKLQTALGHIENYANEFYDGRLEFKHITWQFRSDFIQWLYKPPREHQINHASKVVQILRQFMAEAERQGLHQSTDYKQRGFNIKKVRTKKVVLTFEDLRKLIDLNLSHSDRLKRTRDLFVIGAYSGLRMSDFIRIRPERIIEVDGVEMINLFTQKTNTEVCIPLMPELRSVLEQYGYSSPRPLSNQRMNDYLKELCQMAGLDKLVVHSHSKGGVVQEEHVPLWSKVSSHTARRSFATNFYQLGIPVYILKQITGHSTEKQFFEYINVSPKNAALDMVSIYQKIIKSSS